jgi:hypothetical protein
MPLLSKAGFAESSKCDRGACAPSFSAQVRFGEPGAPVLFLLGPAMTQTPQARKKGTIFRVGDAWARLMTQKLGYKRFGAHGGDWGSTVTEQLARDYSEAVVAIHLTLRTWFKTFRDERHA